MAKSHYAAAALFAVALVACASKQGTEEDTLTPASRISMPEEVELGDARECQSTLDCDEGYICGFDPSRSQVIRYCNPQE